MDPSLLFDPEYLPLIVATLVGFGALAALLLVPIYRFLDREQEVAEKWTPEALAKRMQEKEQAATNGVDEAEESLPSSEDDSSGAGA